MSVRQVGSDVDVVPYSREEAGKWLVAQPTHNKIDPAELATSLQSQEPEVA